MNPRRPGTGKNIRNQWSKPIGPMVDTASPPMVTRTNVGLIRAVASTRARTISRVAGLTNFGALRAALVRSAMTTLPEPPPTEPTLTCGGGVR